MITAVTRRHDVDLAEHHKRASRLLIHFSANLR